MKVGTYYEGIAVFVVVVTVLSLKWIVETNENR